MDIWVHFRGYSGGSRFPGPETTNAIEGSNLNWTFEALTPRNKAGSANSESEYNFSIVFVFYTIRCFRFFVEATILIQKLLGDSIVILLYISHSLTRLTFYVANDVKGLKTVYGE
ncbi:unnamed protein product [Citrullus colocynthis]|uniref:Uncharacterized protein n=1 Tax=Citrullus colocynthis TaxID=252529 RepID=A0ABP0YB09_9ROSI